MQIRSNKKFKNSQIFLIQKSQNRYQSKRIITSKLKSLSNKSGQVTVFLTLILCVLLTSLFAMMEVVRYEQAKGRVSHLGLGVVEHIMADYQVDLADSYHVYALDQNYLGQGNEMMNHRSWDYLEQNLMNINLFGSRSGLYQFSVVDAQVQPIDFLYSSGCHTWKQQIKNWMKDTIIPKNNRVLRSKIKSKRSNKNTTNHGVTESETILDNIDPRELIEEIKTLGVLTVASHDQLPLSKKVKQIQNKPSSNLKWKADSSSVWDKIEQKTAVECYIFSHFQSALSIVKEEETVYENEIEYLISGKSSDYLCLAEVAKKITLLRLPINTAAIMKDSLKKGQAMTAATIICTLSGQIEAVEGVQKGILLAWAYGESVGDVKCLLKGEKVPLTKNKNNWKVSFSQLFYLKLANLKKSKEGMNYEDYLKVLLATIPEKKLYFRMLDLIQGNINLKHPEFKIEDCITTYQVSAQIALDRRFFKIPIGSKKEYQFYINEIGSYQYE